MFPLLVKMNTMNCKMEYISKKYNAYTTTNKRIEIYLHILRVLKGAKKLPGFSNVTNMNLYLHIIEETCIKPHIHFQVSLKSSSEIFNKTWKIKHFYPSLPHRSENILTFWTIWPLPSRGHAEVKWGSKFQNASNDLSCISNYVRGYKDHKKKKYIYSLLCVGCMVRKIFNGRSSKGQVGSNFNNIRLTSDLHE